jgi:DNA-binding HxlR family transcriptional regulator
MASNIENQLRALQNDHKILITLKQAGQLRFTEIHRQTKSSQRTIAKHLKSLVAEGMIEKTGRPYRITELGLESIRHIESQLQELQNKKTPSFVSPQRIGLHEVPEAKQSSHLVGTFQEPKPSTPDKAEGQELTESALQSPIIDYSGDKSTLVETRKKRVFVGGPMNLDNTGDRFFLYISPKVVRDQAFPFRPGATLTLEIQQECLVIRADEGRRTRVPLVSPDPTTSWFKGVCRTATAKTEQWGQGGDVRWKSLE